MSCSLITPKYSKIILHNIQNIENKFDYSLHTVVKQVHFSVVCFKSLLDFRILMNGMLLKQDM